MEEFKMPALRVPKIKKKVVLWSDSTNMSDYFALGAELGRGSSGIVYQCTDKGNGEVFACKSISKVLLETAQDMDLVRKEVMILHTILGMQNAAQLNVTFEDQWNVYMVMEFCSGGELLERVAESGKYSELDAAKIFRSILQVLFECHNMGIVHRDIKPENFMFSDTSPDATVKVIDFGIATFFKPGEVLTDSCGSIMYVAPEVLKGSYGPEVDVWSAGVVLYLLLSGKLPFNGTEESVLKDKLDLTSAPWPSISKSAKDIIMRCLERNPAKRITPEDALKHDWVRVGGDATSTAIDPMVLVRMRSFAGMERVKRLSLQLLVGYLKEEEIEGLRKLYVDMDVDGSGTITLDELKAGLERQGAKVPVAELRQLMSAMDKSEDGQMDYEEFLAATVHYSKMVTSENLFRAFSELDADGSGFVTADEVAAKLQEMGMIDDDVDIKRVIEEVDKNSDGVIDYREFMQLMAPGLATYLTTEEATSDYKMRIAKSTTVPRYAPMRRRTSVETRQLLNVQPPPDASRGSAGVAGVGGGGWRDSPQSAHKTVAKGGGIRAFLGMDAWSSYFGSASS